MKMKVISIGLIVAGIAIIGTAFFMRYSAEKKQNAMIKDFESTIADVDKRTGGSNENRKPPEEEISAIGILKIPKIDLKVAVGEGVDNETLKFAVGHFVGTAMPGELGNFCVAGHRSYTYSEYFNRLDEIDTGDEIIIKTKKGEYKYRVFNKEVVEPTEVSVLNPSKDATLTLVTCTPVRIASHRLIIKAKLEQ